MHHHLTILRHGESQGNATEILQGQIDSDLSEAGRQQARQVALRWQAAGVQFDQIISSPLRRARHTAQIVAEILGYEGEIELNPVWQERGFGELEGRSFAELRETEAPVDYYDPYQPIGAHGESQTDLYLRAASGIQALLRRPPKRYLVASHGALIGKALYAVLGITPQGHHNSPEFHLGNTAYINLAYEASSRQWIFYGINNPREWAGLEGD